MNSGWGQFQWGYGFWGEGFGVSTPILIGGVQSRCKI